MANCDRCLKQCGGNWEEGWPCTGVIDLQAASQAFAKLCGVTHGCADPEHFLVWREGHPAMTKNEAQHVRFEWSASGKYRLCYDCHNELISTVGKFFGFHRRAEQLRPTPVSEQSRNG